MKDFETIKKITIIGGGNIGTYFACQCASKGYAVTVFSQKKEAFSKEIFAVDSDGNEVCRGVISGATDSLEEAVSDADLIFVTYPAFMFGEFSLQIEPFIREGVYIGVIPGTGGAEFAFKNCIEKGAVLFGLQRVPCVARLVEYGKKVCAEGKRDKLFLAAIPNDKSSLLSDFMADTFDMLCDPLDNYLCVTMTPSNPILHTTRLCSMFSDYEEGKVYEKNPLFYGEWSMESSNLLLECDNEHQNMLKMLSELDLSSVKSLKIHYESDTAEKLTAKIRSIKSLNSLNSPMKETENGWIPDFKSRYFTADFPYGLSIIKGLADIVGADIPSMNKTMNWYKAVTGDCSEFDFKKYGINTLEDIYSLYK